jgi:hypothetical protein
MGHPPIIEIAVTVLAWGGGGGLQSSQLVECAGQALSRGWGWGLNLGRHKGHERLGRLAGAGRRRSEHYNVDAPAFCRCCWCLRGGIGRRVSGGVRTLTHMRTHTLVLTEGPDARLSLRHTA